MTPTQHVATQVVTLVTQHSILVTSELHAGIDLARQMVCGQLSEPDTREQGLILGVHGELERRYQRMIQLMSVFA